MMDHLYGTVNAAITNDMMNHGITLSQASSYSATVTWTEGNREGKKKEQRHSVSTDVDIGVKEPCLH